MCGGTIEVSEDTTVAECEYCGSRQTVPTQKDEVITNLFNRANNLRLKSEFDKAAEIYGKILNNDDKISEAHWGLLLCKYGIEYVEDPKTYKRIPTCHRTQYTSVLSDADYLAAVENADAVSKELYIAEGRMLAELQKSILAIVKDEKPFDVFICYKETDENGRRTVDSALANDIYYQLTREGLRVFYSAITLEDKLGIEYEPYIFAALNSARVMLVIGTRPEYFNSVWVKNEWSRYLAIIKTDRNKLLIPCYRDMDAYDLPEEFAHLQAQDMSKIGFINDLVRGIKKVTAKDEPKAEAVVKETVITEGTANIAPLLKRAFMFLEYGEWASADEFAEKVLNIDPECAEAYLVKLMGDVKCKKRELLKECSLPFDDNNNYQKAIRFGDAEFKTEFDGYIKYIAERNEFERLSSLYDKASVLMRENKHSEAYEILKSIIDYKDSEDLAKLCCDEIEKKTKKSEKNKKVVKNIAAILLVVIVTVLVCWDEVADAIEFSTKYKNALALMEKGDYNEAITAFWDISGYKDSYEKIEECNIAILDSNYDEAVLLMEKGRNVEAAIAFGKVGNHKDAKEKSFELWSKIAIRETVSAGYKHSVALKSDGTVVAVGDNDYGQRNVSSWTDIVAVSAGEDHTVGLKSDGTVVAVGDNFLGRCDVSNWSDIVAVSAGHWHTVGLKSDGTVVAVGGNDDASSWSDIVAVSAGHWHTVGLKSDGTVIAVGDNDDGQCDVSSWTDIVAVSASYSHTVGLKSDGTVVAVGDNEYGRCDVSAWSDIVAVSAGGYHTVGLKSDGTVVAVGYNGNGRCDVSSWSDIVAVSAGYGHTVGLKSDGTVVVVGRNEHGQCDVSDWSDISLGKYEEAIKITEENNYNKAVSLMEAGEYQKAIIVFETIGDYKDSAEKIDECNAAILYNSNINNGGPLDADVQYTKLQITYIMNFLLDNLKSETDMKAKKSKNISIVVTDCSVPSLIDSVNNIVEGIVGEGEKTFNYTFTDGYILSTDDPAVSISATPYSLIPPGNKDFYINPNSIVDSSSTVGNDGKTLTITVVLSAESTTLSSPIPRYNSTAIGYIDFADLDVSPAKISQADVQYPGSTISVTCDTTGRIIRLFYRLPITGNVKASLGLSSEVYFEGTIEETWEFTY